MVLVCLFVANDVAWAQPSDYTASKSSTLAAHTALSDPEFKEKFAIGEFLMSIEGAKRYIDEQLTREKNIFEASWRSSRTVTIEDINDLAVRGRIKGEVDGLKSVVIVRIAGLLSSIVQPALVDLFGDIDASKEFNGLPVIYIDSTLNTPDRCLQKHEIDEILQWEYFRVNVLHIEDKKGMAKWIRKHISSPDENLKRTDYKNFSARQIAKLFHGYSYPLRELYATLKDATDFDRDYLRTMLELYGTDDTSPRLNIAAGEVANETSSAVKDDISSVLSMINITPEEAKGRLDVRRKQHEEYLRTQPLSTGESAFRIFDYTSDDKIKILEVLLPLLGKLEAMPKDSASLLNTANFTKIWAQSRLGLYDLAQTTIDIAANSNSDPSSAQAVIDKKRDKQNGLSMLAKAKVKAGDFDGAHRLITQSGINNREDGMLGLLAELGFIKDLVLSLDYEISDPYYMSKDRAYISKVLAHLGLCDAALRLIVDKTKPEDSISAKVEIGITLAELGEREKAETILRDLVECDDKGLYKQPESTLEIIRLQLAIGTDRGLILNTLTKAEDALFQKKLPDNFIDMARLAELYFKMDPDKSREILEKSRQRFIEYTHHSSASDRWQSDFVVLFDCALKLGFYHEAQVMLDQYT
ncbi:MAG: hypothetical protein NTY47_07720, partial [Candidatus Omnitrophica bacterium]|nr:hypothetical protein [Candidatus Omnitrophota bacterium]